MRGFNFRWSAHPIIVKKNLRNTVQHRLSHTHAYTHPYERTHAHPTPMNISERLIWRVIRDNETWGKLILLVIQEMSKAKPAKIILVTRRWIYRYADFEQETSRFIAEK